jgi:hypothetical protein
VKDTIRLNTTIDNRQYQVFTNDRGVGRAAGREGTSPLSAVTGPLVSPLAQHPAAVRRARRILLRGGAPTCPCCTG